MNRWTSYTFRNGKRAPNRVVVPPMASQSADANGFISDRTKEHYSELCKSGAGLLFVEYSFVHVSGKGEPNHLGVNADDKIEGIASLAKIIKDHDMLSGLQIVHNGAKSKKEYCGGELLGASAIRVPTKSGDLDLPRILSLEEVQEMKEWYVAAAGRVSEAGFDFVELHNAHGYGLNQWLSPITNQRSDRAGGGIEGRSNLLLEITRSIKELYPNLLLSTRLPLHDHYENGLTKEDMFWVVGELIDIGLDLIDVSSGIGGWRRPRDFLGEGYLVDDAAVFKAHFSSSSDQVPVIGVGGIKSGPYIDKVIGEGRVDFTAVGRAILKDPSAFYQHVLDPALK